MKNLPNRLPALLMASAITLGLTSCNDSKPASDTTATSAGMSTTAGTSATTPPPASTDPAMSTGSQPSGMADTSGKNLAENSAAVPQTSTLTAALKAAGLDDEAASAGPFTVFAPTNAAFDALPAGALDGLLKPANKQKLVGILTYHVVPGRLMAADLKNGQQLTTIQGEKLTVAISGSNVTVNGATVVKADVPSSNGVAHVINQVLMPKAR